MTGCSKWRHSTGRRWSGMLSVVPLWPHELRPPGSSVHEISQARILEWVAISFSRGIFLTQGPNPHLLHLLHQQILYHYHQWSDKFCDSVVHSLTEKLMKIHKQLLIKEGYLFWSSLDLLLLLLLLSGASHSWTSWFMLGSSLLPIMALLILNGSSWTEKIPRGSFSSQRKLCSLWTLCKRYFMCSFPPAISSAVLPPFSLNLSP